MYIWKYGYVYVCWDKLKLIKFEKIDTPFVSTWSKQMFAWSGDGEDYFDKERNKRSMYTTYASILLIYCNSIRNHSAASVQW